MIPISKEEACATSALTMANAISLIADVVLDIAGNDISNTVDAQPITRDLIEHVAGQTIIAQLTAKVTP